MTFIDLDWISGAFGTPDHHTESQKSALAISDELIDELLEAHEIIIGTPMYNFALPAILKAWIDHVVRFGKTFTYGTDGREGLAEGRKVIIVVASGQKYDGASGLGAYDYELPYLKHILDFIGITDVTFMQGGGTMQVAQNQLSADEFVGGELGISEITVKAHRGQVMQKMKADSLAELVRMAAKLRIPEAPNSGVPGTKS